MDTHCVFVMEVFSYHQCRHKPPIATSDMPNGHSSTMVHVNVQCLTTQIKEVQQELKKCNLNQQLFSFFNSILFFGRLSFCILLMGYTFVPMSCVWGNLSSHPNQMYDGGDHIYHDEDRKHSIQIDHSRWAGPPVLLELWWVPPWL
jgi:hypothetical protein